jgi:hypothetical protein
VKRLTTAHKKIDMLHAQLDEIFAQRDRDFPHRDSQNTLAWQRTIGEYAGSIKDLIDSAWLPDEMLVRSASGMIENAVFICGYMKSGTTFLSSLLDAHPELVVMPGDSRMIQRVVAQSNLEPVQRAQEQQRHWIERLVNPRGQYPFWYLGTNDQLYVEFVQYLIYWLGKLPRADRSYFLAAVLAAYCANPRCGSKAIAWVEKTTRNERRVQEILNLYPSAKFIHIVRDPMTVTSSLKRLYLHREKRWGKFVDIGKIMVNKLAVRMGKVDVFSDASLGAIGFAISIRNHMKAGTENLIALGQGRYHLLRYEDLIAEPEKEMRKIAHFLGIAWNASLLLPTSNGLPASSNSMYADRFVQGKILERQPDRWKNELTTFEQLVSRLILRRVSRNWGYGD